ncbi:DUF6718 family protein [Butyrivibrio sp. AE2005]|uniref:DUF6718 family protein n=1 Tax=Butyrivibrio sp. AE2005 TaxID=1496722 RepID=UPI0004799374|nr:DUF6718 family protein [Butyrivibrio sp. AE2005]
MCYLVAKDINKRGCIALKTKHGPALVSLKEELIAQIGLDRIQLVTISRPTAYGEYAPYSFVKTEDEMREAVLHM